MSAWMGIILAGGILLLCFQAYRAGYSAGKRTGRAVQSKAKKTGADKENRKLRAIRDITHNIDHYDGTGIGQKEVDADESDWIV